MELTPKERRAREKARYDRYKNIKERIERNEPVTFAERNIYNIVQKKKRHKL